MVTRREAGDRHEAERNCLTIQDQLGDEHSQGLRTHSRQPKDGRGLFGHAQEDANRLCGQAMRPQARWLPMLHPEPTWRNEHCRNGSSRSEAQPSGASEVICYLSVFHLLFEKA